MQEAGLGILFSYTTRHRQRINHAIYNKPYYMALILLSIKHFDI